MLYYPLHAQKRRSVPVVEPSFGGSTFSSDHSSRQKARSAVVGPPRISKHHLKCSVRANVLQTCQFYAQIGAGRSQLWAVGVFRLFSVRFAFRELVGARQWTIW
jgi:hypothetical protein